VILCNNAHAHLCTDVVYAASVLAANSVLRSLFGTAFPLFTTRMYENLGNQWASSLALRARFPVSGALCGSLPEVFIEGGEGRLL
jgi:hypothetical protein